MNNLEFEALCRSFEGIYPGASPGQAAQPETEHASILMAGAECRVSEPLNTTPGALGPGKYVISMNDALLWYV